MIDDHARQMITNWHQDNHIKVDIRCTALDHDARKSFDGFCEAFSRLAPGVKILPVESETNPPPLSVNLPGLILKENIFYAALPLERELAPFLDGLTLIHTRTPLPDKAVLQKLNQIKVPCHLTLYIARQCPHCPGVVNAVFPLAVFCDNIRLTIIDGSLFPEAAQKDKVMSAPCLILDNEFRWTGAVGAEEILAMILDRDPAALSAESLKHIIEEGNAQWVADQMVQARAIFPGFIALLLHDIWSVRLGAMVVVESLSEEHPDLAVEICPLLIQAFDRHETPVQGDILYALGQAGDRETEHWIRDRLKDLSHDDLKDAAQEAIEEILSRY